MSKEERFEQLELPFGSKPKSKPTAEVKATGVVSAGRSGKRVPRVTNCMRTWAELKDGNYLCNGCGKKFQLLEDYNLHLRAQEEEGERPSE